MQAGRVPLYRAHSFLTQMTDMPMTSAISLFVIRPFRFCRIIHAVLDRFSFITVPVLRPPICL